MIDFSPSYLGGSGAHSSDRDSSGTQMFVVIGDNGNGTLRLDMLNNEPTIDSLQKNPFAILCITCSQASFHVLAQQLFSLEKNGGISEQQFKIYRAANKLPDTTILWEK